MSKRSSSIGTLSYQTYIDEHIVDLSETSVKTLHENQIMSS